MKKIIKEDYLILIVMLISLILHIIVLFELGYDYTLNSDDASYIKSGITFLETGKITMHGVISAQIMPGMTFLIAFFALFLGKAKLLILGLKIFWILMGISTIYVVYKCIRLYTNKIFAVLPCLFFLAADYLWMDNIILTETPFIFCFALLVYHSLKLAETKDKKNYIFIIIWYIAALLIRPNIGPFPIFLAIYLLLCKYDFKLLIKQGLIAGIILLIFLVPWTYRNYKLYDAFIPLTFGMGNPLLLGTYQGVGYPSDEELDYITNVDEKRPKEMKYYLDNKDSEPYLRNYYSLEYDGMKAKYRMEEWWKKDKKSMLKSYLYYKPKQMIYTYFYWYKVLGIDDKWLALLRKTEIILSIIGIISIILDKKYIKELLFLLLVYISQIALYSYSFAFSRYAITLFFLRYIIIGIGLYVLYERIKEKVKWRFKNESISGNTSIQRGTKHKKNSKQNK